MARLANGNTSCSILLHVAIDGMILTKKYSKLKLYKLQKIKI